MATASDSDGDHTGHVPLNHRLWDMLVNQAKARFRVYPSLPASKWIHTEYVHRGGQFGNSEKKDDRHDKHGNLTREGKKEVKNKKASDTRVGTSRGNNQQISKKKVIL